MEIQLKLLHMIEKKNSSDIYLTMIAVSTFLWGCFITQLTWRALLSKQTADATSGCQGLGWFQIDVDRRWMRPFYRGEHAQACCIELIDYSSSGTTGGSYAPHRHLHRHQHRFFTNETTIVTAAPTTCDCCYNSCFTGWEAAVTQMVAVVRASYDSSIESHTCAHLDQ